MKRGRGRPRKIPLDPTVAKIRRGRPRKIPLDPTVAKIGRGRPRKIPLDPTVAKMKASKSKKTKKSRKDVEIVDEKADGDKGGEEEGEEEEEGRGNGCHIVPGWRQTPLKQQKMRKTICKSILMQGECHEQNIDCHQSTLTP